MTESDHIEIRSEEVQEIVGQSPAWLLRSGTILILALLLLLLLASCFFRYPDSISARIVVLSDNPPASIVARADGKIDRMVVSNGQFVKRGDVLAVLENPANDEDVFELNRELIDHASFFNAMKPSLFYPFRRNFQLGDLQQDYSTFIGLCADYATFMKLNYYPGKIASLHAQVGANRIYYSRMEKQTADAMADWKLSIVQFRRDSLLYRKGVLALSDYDKSRSEVLQKRYQYHSMQASLALLRRDLIQQRQLTSDAGKDYAEQKNKVIQNLKEAYFNLRSHLASWEKNYAFIAPVDGQVSFSTVWNDNQQVKTGDIVFTIVPRLRNRVVGRITLPIVRAGKVKQGQTVNVKFDNFPHMEFGMLKGKVEGISMVPQNDHYIVEVSLPDRLITNYKMEIPFGQEMQGDAEIITTNQSLLQRIMNPIRSMWTRHVMK